MSAFAHQYLRRPQVQRRSRLLRVAVSFICTWSVAQAAAPTFEPSKPELGKDTEEVLVTAQRREENLRDVPISISVMDGAQLDSSSATSVADALVGVPGLVSSQNQYTAGTVNFSVRGVSNAIPRSAGAGVIAYYLDGVPYGFIRSAYNPDPNVYDLAQVEFLSGPQGTLYGAGSLVGVLRIQTHDADVDNFELKARTYISMTKDGGDNAGGDVAVNVPLMPGVLGMRATVGYRDDSGWIDSPIQRDVNTDDVTNYRLRLRAELSNSLAISLSAWRSVEDIGAPNLSTDSRRINSLQDQSGSNEFTTYALTVEREFSAFTLSSVTSLLDFYNGSYVDGSIPAIGAGAVLQGKWNSRVWAQEFNVVSDIEGPWHWSAGLFYRDASEDAYQFLDRLNNTALPDIVQNDYADSSTSYAIYGEVGRDLTDTLQISVGLRYFNDDGVTTLEKPYANVVSFPAGTKFEFESEAVTPRVVLTWTPNDDQMIYASYSQGFRSGASQQPNVLAGFPEFEQLDPDRLTNYEIGTKGKLFDGAVTYTAAAFYMDWQDVQQSLRVVLTNTCNSSGSCLITEAQINGDRASGPGVELGLVTHLFEGLQLGFNAAWNDLRTNAPIFRAVAPPGTPILLFAKGDRLEFSPEYTIGFNGEYERSLGGSYVGKIALSANYNSPTNDRAMISADTNRASDDMLIVNSRLSVKTDHWVFTIFGDNLTDENGTNRPIGVAPEWSPRGRPMTVGLQLEYRF